MSKHARSLTALSGLTLTLALGLGCGAADSESQADDLTSAGALQRQVEIHGFVYVSSGASSSTIQDAVREQIRTAFGPLRIGQISVDDREFEHNVDAKTFKSETVHVMKPASTDAAPTELKTVQRVSYTYSARGLVSKSLSKKSTFSLALLMGDYNSFVPDIIHACVEDYDHDREFASDFWYVFAPNESACQKLIQAEAEQVSGSRSRMGLGANQISEVELNRRFLPVSAKLTNPGAPPTTYPEYQRLYGLDDPSKTTISVATVFGVAAHSDEPENTRFANDMGFAEFFKMLDILETQYPHMKVSAGQSYTPLSFSFKGKTYTAQSFEQLGTWATEGYDLPADVSSAQTEAFRRAIYDHMVHQWFQLDVPIHVASGAVQKDMHLQFNSYFGTEADWQSQQIFRTAFLKNDVVVYDGHSYIGSGPLDPDNYEASDFKSGYQIFLFNSCVSFNYYSVDFFSFKPNGSQDLELVSNGLEVYINDGGKSMGQFITAIFDGKQHSWLDVLKRTRIDSYGSTYDPNRAVDGELDNVYKPKDIPIKVTLL